MMYYILFRSFLFIHLIGLVMFAGTTLVDLVLFKQFWKTLGNDRQVVVNMSTSIIKVRKIMSMGGGVLVLSGLVMVALQGGVYGHYTWFQIKMIVLVLLILNQVLIGQRNLKKLFMILEGGAVDTEKGLTAVRKKIGLSQWVQVLFLLTIVFLSVFKFG